MAIKLTTTNKSASTVNILVYGRAGVGKTTLCTTAPNPIIISVENGLLSIKDSNLPVIEVSTFKDLKEAYKYVKSSKGKKYKTVCLDSISDIAEMILIKLKKEHKDPRKAYLEMSDKITEMVRKFRDLRNHHTYITAKERPIDDDVQGGPFAPGKTLNQNLPYMFDEMLRLYVHGDEEDEQEKTYRAFQTAPSYEFDAKDRSGKLNKIEKPDLSYIFEKMLSPKKAKNKKRKK